MEGKEGHRIKGTRGAGGKERRYQLRGELHRMRVWSGTQLRTNKSTKGRTERQTKRGEEGEKAKIGVERKRKGTE